MISVTEQKPLEEILQSLDKCQAVYLVGCGTCTTMLHTGGKAEVLEMKDKLEAAGKKIAGWMVIPTACDEVSKYALQENDQEIEAADCLLVMSCAYGVQNVSQWTDKPALPAVNTLFIGAEYTPGEFSEVCRQCGDCVLAWTGGICPVTACAKGLLNGPCGGTNEGKCEVDPEKDCAWTLIYNRLEKQGRLDLFEKEQAPKNYQAVVRPGKITVK
ncbi:MAG: methylenetetrahydrofolate reductase C-terminal domain-containing protein [Dehalococcoidales bacterium]|nr:methylenetetrahydrofolate reductase C-terminal domain-containing protein [Dehalococcoidales bacterium]